MIGTGKADTLPYETFKKLKDKYPAKMVLITDFDVQSPGVQLAYANHREFVAAKLKQAGIEVYRYAHNYDSLNTNHPELGLVYLANDSVINPGLEVWALIGHNAKWVSDEA